MSEPVRRFQPFLTVTLPVGVAVVLVCLALLNIAAVRSWRGELEDGVLWARVGTANVVAREIAPASAAARAGVLPGDVLVLIDGREVTSERDPVTAAEAATPGQKLSYVISRESVRQPVELTLQLMPLTQFGLYYSLAAVGILSLFIGAAVRLRRPADPSTLHFFWLSVAFFGAFAFRRRGGSTASTTCSGGPTSSRSWPCRPCSSILRSSFGSARMGRDRCRARR